VSDHDGRQAYYKAAMACHPDKHPGDATAEERFKRVGHAYHVLSTPELKERYDRFGLDAFRDGTGTADIDPKALFTAMFGGGKFEVCPPVCVCVCVQHTQRERVCVCVCA
jgi:molecular chaperone DnaJ